MTCQFPDFLAVPPGKLGDGTSVTVVGDIQDVARHFARALVEQIKAKPNVTMILPVGPVDQFPLLARMINDTKLDCRDVMIINMDEYLAEDDQWVSIDHPLSFRGFMNRMFYDQVDHDLAPRAENRIFPDPGKLAEVSRAIDERGGLDA